MPGFSFLYNMPNLSIDREDALICDRIIGSKFEINRFTLNKFINDKVFIETDNLVIVLEGIVLNKKDLLVKHQFECWEKLVCFLYRKNISFFKEFRGSFCGLVYNKEEDECIIFTDQLGTKHLYYYIEDKSFFTSSEISDLYIYFNKEKIEYQLDSDAAYNLLSYGYMLNNDTLCKKIKKIEPGSYILIKDDIICNYNYYKLPLASKHTNLTENEIIEKIDEKFRKAVSLQFEKDKEYGYQHFVALSGGLDSRMTSWIAHELGYIDQINFTFSQSNYLDETIPKKIASDLKHEWIFKALDNGLFLEDIDEVTAMSGGNVLYYGLAHGNSMLKLINFKNLGVLHSGQLGDIIIGTFVKSLLQDSLAELDGAYSKTLLNKSDKTSTLSAEEIEHKLIYQRGVNGANNGLVISQYYSETISPFYDIDFFEFCLSIPIKLRINHNLYKKWISSKYPKATDYVWEATKNKINKKELSLQYKGRSVPISRIFEVILIKSGLKRISSETKNHMNPLDYWYSTNVDIKTFQDVYYEENISLISDDKLRRDCTELYKNGNAVEKNQVLTLLGASKLFFKRHY